MKNNKIIVSLVALNLALSFAYSSNILDTTSVVSASAETMTPQELNDFFISQNTKEEKTITLDEVVELFKENGYENYYIYTDRSSSNKIIKYWWGLKKDGEDFKYAESIKCGDFYYSLNDKNEAEINGYDGLIDKLIIPETLDGHTVTALASPFKGDLYFNENNILTGCGGGGGGGFGGNNHHADENNYYTELYLPFNCKMNEPHCLYVSTFYIFKGSVVEPYLKENNLNYKYREDIQPETGDADGNGEINVTDIAVTAAHIKAVKALDEKSRKAADVDGNGKIEVTDIAMIAAHIKGIKALPKK